MLPWVQVTALLISLVFWKAIRPTVVFPSNAQEYLATGVNLPWDASGSFGG
ncbi:hypothetical protein [Schaalia sp. ZJ1691]|uniref:hypothetical protein n=1 Tax=Schaalia sp. ZJ1691 TaxID=2709404 RepID=UPI0013EC1737|nr:hypothetical protein [Schaalia sp. ZJ1691]